MIPLDQFWLYIYITEPGPGVCGGWDFGFASFRNNHRWTTWTTSWNGNLMWLRRACEAFISSLFWATWRNQPRFFCGFLVMSCKKSIKIPNYFPSKRGHGAAVDFYVRGLHFDGEPAAVLHFERCQPGWSYLDLGTLRHSLSLWLGNPRCHHCCGKCHY